MPVSRYMPLADRLETYSTPEPNSGCLLWTGSVFNSGYPRLHWKGKSQIATRLTWVAAHGPIPEGMEVCHKCDVPTCVNPDHLWLGTPKQNSQDREAKGRGAGWRGLPPPRGGGAKLTEAQVRAIRMDPRNGAVVGRAYGVGRACVSAIRTRTAWEHVQ
jgi:hypothetical protein